MCISLHQQGGVVAGMGFGSGVGGVGLTTMIAVAGEMGRGRCTRGELKVHEKRMGCSLYHWSIMVRAGMDDIAKNYYQG